MVNPKFLHQEDFSNQCQQSLEQVDPNLEYNFVKEWQKGNSNANITTDLSLNVVPEFHLEVSLKKWGTIKVDTIRINCANEDAEYLEYYLSSTASDQDILPQGVFIPTGLHLMEGKEIVNNILVEHSNYVSNTMGILITGILFQSMKYTTVDQQQTIEENLLALGDIQSIERTRDTDFSGRWLAVTTKDKHSKIRKFLTTKLAEIYRQQKGQTRMITVGSSG